MASKKEEFRQVLYFIYMHFKFLFLFSFTCESIPIVFELFTQRKCRVLGCTSNMPLTFYRLAPCLKKYSDVLLYDRNIIGPSSKIFGDLRKSSVIFGKCSENVRKRSSTLQNNFGKSSEIFGKWSEIFGKSSKTSLLVFLYNKQNITCPLVDMNFIFSCSTRYLTRSLRSLVR